MANNNRQYDIVLFGATGYTGKLTASYIAKHAPTNIKWAIAGRSESKLEAVLATCQSLNPNRIQPAVEICNLDDAELGDLARKTKVLITTVGPFCIYGEYAFKACAENGTHYLDCTGEAPWVLKMIRKYEKAAKSTGAIMIPQIGVESAPEDLITWSLVSLIRQKISAPTAHVILSVHEIKSPISGGTAATFLCMVDHVTFEELSASQKPFGLSPIPGPKSKPSASWFTKLFGVRTVPPLGLQTSSIQGFSDVPIVMRSWGVLGGSRFYGPNFFYEQCQKVNGYFLGIAMHLVANIGSILLLLRPLRWLLKNFMYAPGDGPTEQQKQGNRAEWRAVANADVANKTPPRAYGRAYYNGSMYDLTGLIMSEAALTILKDDVVATKSGGGILTPATLGQTLIDRLDKAGFKFEAKMLES